MTNSFVHQMERTDPVIPNRSDSRLAAKTGQQLATLLQQYTIEPIRLANVAESGEQLEIPAPAMHLLVEILAEMAKGHAVTLVPVAEEISTQQAAELLNVSRPFFVGLLENGEIAFRKVGARRRVRLQDVLAYKQTLYQKRVQALDELTAYDQELGLQ